METKFNKTVQKHRRRLLPNNWQEKLPLRPLLFGLGMLAVILVAILVNQPADSYLNNAEIDVLRKKGTLRVGIDENICCLNQNGAGLEPALSAALSEVIFSSADGCENQTVTRHTVTWQMSEGNIDIAIMSLEKQGNTKLKPSVVGLTEAFKNLGQECKSVSDYQDIAGKQYMNTSDNGMVMSHSFNL